MKIIFDKTHLYPEYPALPTAITFLTYFIIPHAQGWILLPSYSAQLGEYFYHPTQHSWVNDERESFDKSDISGLK